MVKKIAALLLAFTLALSLGALPASAALSNRDAYYLSVLKPGNMPKAKESYPVKLLVEAPTTWLIQGKRDEQLEFKGTCGVDAEITDEEMLELLKESLSAVKGYQALQNPVDDKVLVQQLTDKLKISDKDIDDMLDNWKKLWGVDTVADLLSGKLPDIGASDVVNSIIDGLQGDIPMLPGVPGVGTVIDGVFISYEQWQQDQAKWKDIVSISQANQRLRAFYSKLSSKIKDKLVEKGVWTVRIDSQDWAEFRFEAINGNKQIWTADVELKKNDGDYGNITGSYTGRFELKMDCDLSVFDNILTDHFVEFRNVRPNALDNKRVPGDTVLLSNKLQVYAGDGGRGDECRWSAVSNTGSPSVLQCAFEIPDCELNLALPAGTNRAFFEIPIPAYLVYMTEYTRQVDRTVAVVGVDSYNSYYYTYRLVMNDDMITVSDGEYPDSWSDIDDYSASLSMTLIIDMLGN